MPKPSEQIRSLLPATHPHTELDASAELTKLLMAFHHQDFTEARIQLQIFADWIRRGGRPPTGARLRRCLGSVCAMVILAEQRGE